MTGEEQGGSGTAGMNSGEQREGGKETLINEGEPERKDCREEEKR